MMCTKTANWVISGHAFTDACNFLHEYRIDPDLGGVRTLDSIEMDWYYIYGTSDFDIEYSTDGVLFLPIHTSLSEPGTSSWPYVALHTQSLDQIEASHVRLVIHQAVQPFPVLSEVRIFGWMAGL